MKFKLSIQDTPDGVSVERREINSSEPSTILKVFTNEEDAKKYLVKLAENILKLNSTFKVFKMSNLSGQKGYIEFTSTAQVPYNANSLL